MNIEQIIVPSGILSFVLFAFAFINGIPRFRLIRYHGVTGYACCAVVLIHTAAALSCHIFEPLGMLASIGMLLTTAFFPTKDSSTR